MRFDPATRQYKTKRGKVVAAAVVIGLRNAITDRTRDEAKAITTDYLTAKASLADWADRFAGLVRDSVVAGYLLGRGGQNAAGPTDTAAVAPALRTQLAAARSFTPVLAAAPKPVVDDNGDIINPDDLSIDDNGDVVDANGDPVMVDGQPLTEGDFGSLGVAYAAVDALLARAGSYGSAAIAGYSAGQSAAWDSAELPEMPPEHPSCACSASFRVDDDGQILGSWIAGAGACLRCLDLASEYTDYETGVYVTDGSDVPSDEGDG